jgi:tRNA-dihydrouridine synthase B
LKIRTGWNAQNKNAMRIASIAEDAGVAMIAVHGRTRDMMYNGVAEHETVAEIKSKLRIPVVVNGDIDTPEKAKELLESTNADAVMIGRAAQGRPWIFREINHYLETGKRLAEPSFIEIGKILAIHLARLYDFYGEESGVRIARKHLGWYSKGHGDDRDFRATINRAGSAVEQLMLSQEYFALRYAESIGEHDFAEAN